MDVICENKLVKLSLKRAKVKYKRSVFVISGSNAINRVDTFYRLLTKKTNKDISILLCGKNSEDFSNINLFPERASDKSNIKDKITFMKYSEIKDVLYQSFNLAILYNIEDIYPSSLAYIIEAIKGGGVVLFIFSKNIHVDNKKISVCTNSRFIKRLCASFTSCSSCIILNDKLETLSQGKDVSFLLKDLEKSPYSEELYNLKNENTTEPIAGALLNICQTVDQAKIFLKFFDALKKRTFYSTLSVSSPKGRGKSAVLGLAIAASLALNYSNIFISSLEYENVKIVFRFLFKGLDALNYKEDEDYDLIQSVNPKFKNVLLGINIFRNHPQAVRFIFPGDVENKIEQAELVIIDEAAAIPLPLLNRLIGSYVVLMASTAVGCEGTGKFLYEHMLREIRQPQSIKNESKIISPVTLFPSTDKSFERLTLSEPINYANGDEVESWTNQLMCLECSLTTHLSQGCPEPLQCRLFYVNQEILFSYENHAEKFLQQLISLFLSSKRTLSPDLLSKIADDCDYHIFCLLAPFDSCKKITPEILCAIMVHREKRVPSNIVYSGVNQEENLTECFNEWKTISKKGSEEFLPNSGVHILDIVTHPEYRRMGYGFRALQLLQEFYENKWVPLDDTPFLYSSINKMYNRTEQDNLSLLLLQLSEVEPEKIDYILVSYFLSPAVLRFWKKSSFVPVYISGEKNSAQEHLCLMLKPLAKDFQPYLQESWRSFCEYYFLLLNSELKYFSSSFALNLLKSSFNSQLPKKTLAKEDIDIYLNPQRMKSLEKYCHNLGDLHCIMPCIPVLTKLFFRNHFSQVVLPVVQEVILLSFGLQHKTIDEISKELGLPSTQVHGLLNRSIRKLFNYLTSIIESAVEKTIKSREVCMEPVAQSLDEELEEAAKRIQLQQLEESKKLKDMDFSQYAIKGSEDDWEKALHSGRKTLVSIKSIKKAPEDVEFPVPAKNSSFKTKKKHVMKRKR